MHAGVAPVSVQAVLGERGLAAAQLEQRAAGRQGDFGAQCTRFGDGNGGGSHAVGVAFRTGPVQVFTCAFEQGFSRV